MLDQSHLPDFRNLPALPDRRVSEHTLTRGQYSEIPASPSSFDPSGEPEPGGLIEYWRTFAATKAPGSYLPLPARCWAF